LTKRGGPNNGTQNAHKTMAATTDRFTGYYTAERWNNKVHRALHGGVESGTAQQRGAREGSSQTKTLFPVMEKRKEVRGIR